MRAQPQQDSLTQSLPGVIKPPGNLMSASVAEWQQQKWRQDQEKEWEGHLRSLQKCICELLTKNEKLRDSHVSVTNHQSKEFADAYDQSV